MEAVIGVMIVSASIFPAKKMGIQLEQPMMNWCYSLVEVWNVCWLFRVQILSAGNLCQQSWGFGASENLLELRTSLPRASLRLGDFSTEGPRHLSRTCVEFLYNSLYIHMIYAYTYSLGNNGMITGNDGNITLIYFN